MRRPASRAPARADSRPPANPGRHVSIRSRRPHRHARRSRLRAPACHRPQRSGASVLTSHLDPEAPQGRGRRSAAKPGESAPARLPRVRARRGRTGSGRPRPRDRAGAHPRQPRRPHPHRRVHWRPRRSASGTDDERARLDRGPGARPIRGALGRVRSGAGGPAGPTDPVPRHPGERISVSGASALECPRDGARTGDLRAAPAKAWRFWESLSVRWSACSGQSAGRERSNVWC